MGDKGKKKLTKKELKAQNHAKLMSSKKGGFAPISASDNSNVVDITAYQNKDKKKAA
ncbi:MAG: hypothetical protein K2P81_13080 [Bacteriovoracaceae bacterium]|nr:hypothetical protein [Bacteriovoracaceae bacterium]